MSKDLNATNGEINLPTSKGPDEPTSNAMKHVQFQKRQSIAKMELKIFDMNLEHIKELDQLDLRLKSLIHGQAEISGDEAHWPETVVDQEKRLLKFTSSPFKNFWINSMLKIKQLELLVKPYDLRPLSYLDGVSMAKSEYFKDEALTRNIRVSFHFLKNPYFTNATLWIGYKLDFKTIYDNYENPGKWMPEVSINDTSTIDWIGNFSTYLQYDIKVEQVVQYESQSFFMLLDRKYVFNNDNNQSHKDVLCTIYKDLVCDFIPFSIEHFFKKYDFCGDSEIPTSKMENYSGSSLENIHSSEFLDNNTSH